MSNSNIYEDLLNNIRLTHKNSKQLLSDKNRLIASTSSNIQTSTDKLEDLNNKINEANQEISKNNIDEMTKPDKRLHTSKHYKCSSWIVQPYKI